MSDVKIRPYEPRDRDRVRHVCYATGYMGERVDWLWRDRESFCDLFTSYYTDAEPQSALVAELDGVVEGYLLGCVDSSKAWSVPKIFLRHMFVRGIAFRPGTAPVVWRSFSDIVMDGIHRQLPTGTVHDERWPAHLHIDLLPRIRGLGVGSRLVRMWLDSLREKNVAGCHLETVGENHGAIAFFESMGFRRHGRAFPIPGWRSPKGQRHTIQLFAQSLEGPP
jgi:ribosomal protein S18 acetylase RimI-like enzyme